MHEIIWERRDCANAEIDGSLVLLDLETLLYHSLNHSAAFVWVSLATPKTASKLQAELLERYDVTPDTCRASVDRIIAALLKKKLIAPKGQDASSDAV